MNTKEIKLPPMPEWAKMDNLNGMVPSEIRSALNEFGREAVRLNAQAAPDGLKEKLTDLLADGLRGTWHCNRVWEAWHVGTMSEDDFEPVEESDTPAELADAVIAMLSAAPAAPAQPLDLSVMDLAESVGLIGPASRTDDLHDAIRRFHDLIVANASIKAALHFARAVEQASPLLALVAELEAKLVEVQKDAARLDYVATGKVTFVSRDNGGFQLAWYDHNSQKLKWQNSWHETARAAIDAALAAEERAHGITED
jgi:hypothetical protein